MSPRPRPLLTTLLRLSPEPEPSALEPEDFMQDSLTTIFDAVVNQHGDGDLVGTDREQKVVFSTGVEKEKGGVGEVKVGLYRPGGGWEQRGLFAHYVWNAGVLGGVLIEGEEEGGEGEGVQGGGKKREVWTVQNDSLLEVGSGTGLVGIVAALKGAARVVISDYPEEGLVGNIRANVDFNIKDKDTREKVEVRGHEWGVVEGGWERENRGAFGRVVACDCLWMPGEHGNLRRSLGWFLRGDGRAWVIAGFHTGREKLRGFFDKDALAEVGLEIEELYERNAYGEEREWVDDRGYEDNVARKSWLVVGVLRRIGGGS
ncbi:nicotinamide N-methyltransferase protein [Rutstroemia sp. NJR-2017a WRK4]|nr:nicotinamide N-methyltransferase protein [Rutstroemia sp. NJR-2017a WRK4]